MTRVAVLDDWQGVTASESLTALLLSRCCARDPSECFREMALVCKTYVDCDFL